MLHGRAFDLYLLAQLDLFCALILCRCLRLAIKGTLGRPSLTGINQDGKTILLGVSLLQREDAWSFEWAFEKFAESMSDGSSDDSAGGGDWRPDTIFTDSDVAMGAAIKRVWQGLTLVHFSAQRERFLWDRVCI